MTVGVLPPEARLRRSADFRSVLRSGRRAGRPLLVAHLLPAPAGVPGDQTPQVGFAVSRAVGGSVVRSRVARRLRHQMRPRLQRLPAGSKLVVRALPAAADADSARLGAELDVVLARLARVR